MAQSSITNYFSKRKRTGEDIKSRSKVLVLDHHGSETNFAVGKDVFVVHKVSKLDVSHSEISSSQEYKPTRELLHEKIEPVLSEEQRKGIDKRINNSKLQGRPKTVMTTHSKSSTQLFLKNKQTGVIGEISKDVTTVKNKTPNLFSEDEPTFMKAESSDPSEFNCAPAQGPVVFELKGNLSPSKKLRTDGMYIANNDEHIKNVKLDTQENCSESSSVMKIKENGKECSVLTPNEKDCSGDNRHEVKENGKKYNLMTPNKMSCGKDNQPKELSFDEVKKKLSRSSKIAELRESLSRFNKNAEKLKEVEQKRKHGKPQLEKFQAIEIEVPVSPQKSPFCSPQKVGTSTKFSPTKSPAYQRFSTLALSAPAVLPLPYSYRCLAEVFRCVDVVASMLYKRKEVITFQKLKPAVQEMLRKNVMERHLGQIKKIYPNAYIFHREKCRKFGSVSKIDQYELTLTPLLQAKVNGNTNSSEPEKFTSFYLLERKKTFHENLLKSIKKYHDEFLQCLDPPLMISQKELTRWHPEFDIDQVPDIEPDSLPQPPNLEKYCSAKDVLERARNLLNCNLRMEKALRMVSERSSRVTPSGPSKSVEKDSSTPISTLLKGVPKALLEKVRAKQAAKAIQAMTRSSAQDRVAIQYMRLPELARILRNLYVTEKKSILPLDFTLEKLGNSYREKLPRAELEEHIHLLRKTFPSWLAIHNVRQTNYLKLSKHADMSPIMEKLMCLTEEKSER